MTRALLLASLILVLPAAARDEATRSAMNEIVRNLEVVFPLSVSEDRFSSSENRETVRTALAALATASRRLEAHGGGRDASFGYLSGVLANDLREIDRRYSTGQYRSARFMLHNTVETCMTCHARLPSGESPEIGARFLASLDLEGQPLDERAKLEAATRQFEAALGSYETLFVSPAHSPGDTELLGGFVDYLEICIRVEGDLERAGTQLRKVASRSDLSPALRRNLESWIASIETLRQRMPEPKADRLETARRLVAEGEALAGGDALDARALVLYIAASKELYLLLDAQPDVGAEAAETYYWLGLIESRIGRSAWLSQAEPYLEAAIRTAPQEPVAKQAYALLEEVLVMGYTGSAGQNVPAEVKARLAELKALSGTP